MTTMTSGPVAGVSSSQVGRLFLRLLRREVPLLSKALRVLLGSDIYCRVPATTLLPHPYGIVMHPDVTLGEHVVVMHQVTVGQVHPADVRVPTIGDGVYLGAGAKILGPITVGAGALVGANAVVTRDIPAGVTVVGANRILP